MSQISEQQILEYLFGEIDDEARESFEIRLAEDEDLFYQVLDSENELVDSFVAETLDTVLRARFESSLKLFPERAQNVANARALHEHIEHSKRTVQPARESEGTWSRVRDFQMGFIPSAGFTVAIVLMIAAIVFLAIENRRYAGMIAELDQKAANPVLTPDPQQDLAGDQIAGELTVELERERELSERYRNEADALRARLREPASSVRASEKQEVRAVTFDQNRRVRDINEIAQTSTDGPEWTSAVIELPDDALNETITIKLNDATIQAGRKPVKTSGGKVSINLRIEDSALKAGENKITIYDSTGRQIGSYVLNAAR